MPEDLPLKPPADPKPLPTPVPALIPFAAVWLSLLCLLSAIILPFVPGSEDPEAELTHARPYSFADWQITITLYAIAIALFLSIVTFWQMRRHPRPLPQGLVNQRLQAWTALTLGLLATIIIYTYVAFKGPTAH